MKSVVGKGPREGGAAGTEPRLSRAIKDDTFRPSCEGATREYRHGGGVKE